MCRCNCTHQFYLNDFKWSHRESIPIWMLYRVAIESNRRKSNGQMNKQTYDSRFASRQTSNVPQKRGTNKMGSIDMKRDRYRNKCSNFINESLVTRWNHGKLNGLDYINHGQKLLGKPHACFISFRLIKKNDLSQVDFWFLFTCNVTFDQMTMPNLKIYTDRDK